MATDGIHSKFSTWECRQYQVQYKGTEIEYRGAMRMMIIPNNAVMANKYLAQQSRYNIINAMYQARLPMSDEVHGANRMS